MKYTIHNATMRNMTEFSYTSQLQRAALLIKKHKHFYIFSHKNPDGDTVGSALALACALQKIGKKFSLICPDPIPSRFGYLPYSELYSARFQKVKGAVAISVDMASFSQMGDCKTHYEQALKRIRVDHHDEGDLSAECKLIDVKAAANAEIVYDLILKLGVKPDKHIAECILSAIFVDTGLFRFSNLRPKTLQVCAALSDLGVDLTDLAEKAYRRRSKASLSVTAHALSRSVFTCGGRLAYTLVTQKMFQTHRASIDDADGAVDELRQVEGVQVAALFRKSPKGFWRVSLRSGENINVSLIAKHFGGGGHFHSAGFSFKPTGPTTLKRVIAYLCDRIML